MSRCHLLVLLLCASVIGCGNSAAAQRTVTKQLMSATKEMADLLATVKDKPSAQAVAPKLLTLIDRVDKLNERLEEMETEDSYYHDTELLQEVGFLDCRAYAADGGGAPHQPDSRSPRRTRRSMATAYRRSVRSRRNLCAGREDGFKARGSPLSPHGIFEGCRAR